MAIEAWGLAPNLLAGRVALVTGGARGLGFAIANALRDAGATTLVCGRTPPVDQMEGAPLDFVACDVRKADQVAAMIETIAARHGRLDIVVNNAGGSPLVGAAQASPRLSEAIIALNLTAPLHVAAASHALLAAAPGGGVIVNIASLSGTRPSPGTAAYGAAKAGLLNLTRTLAMEWGPRVRVNAVTVGLVAMEGGDEHYGGTDARERIAAQLPLGRMVDGVDVAKAVLYLCSPLGVAVTGAALEVHSGGERPYFLTMVDEHGERSEA